MSVLGAVFGLVIAGQFALQGGSSGVLIAVLVVSGLLSASTWVTLKPAIRRADEHGSIRRRVAAWETPGTSRLQGHGGAALHRVHRHRLRAQRHLGRGYLLVLGAPGVGLGIWMLRRRPTD